MQPEADPDAAWVAALAGRSPATAAARIAQAGGERRLYAQLDRAHRREGRVSYVEIDAPLELHAIVRLLRPRDVVEVGVSSGVSSAYLLHALARNGRGTLHSVDLPSRAARGAAGARMSWTLPPGRDTGWAVPQPLRHRWDLRIGDKADVIPRLARELDRIDLVLYDVPHREADLDAEFALLDRRLPDGAVVIVDHGISGDLCRALAHWGVRRGAEPVRRRGSGLHGIRCGARARAASPQRK